MKNKILATFTIIITNFTWAQINLDHSFDHDQSVGVFSDEISTKYVTLKDFQVIIYNSDFSIYKTFVLPNSGSRYLIPTTSEFPNAVSRYLFNNDEKLEFFVYEVGSNAFIYNEDGDIIMNFNKTYSYELVRFMYDVETKSTKLIMGYFSGGGRTFDIYLLPSTTLGNNNPEIKTFSKAYPIPASQILHIENTATNKPTKVEVYDLNGKKVLSKDTDGDKNISLDVSALTKGIYMYKINNVTEKFIKN